MRIVRMFPMINWAETLPGVLIGESTKSGNQGLCSPAIKSKASK